MEEAVPAADGEDSYKLMSEENMMSKPFVYAHRLHWSALLWSPGCRLRR